MLQRCLASMFAADRQERNLTHRSHVYSMQITICTLLDAAYPESLASSKVRAKVDVWVQSTVTKGKYMNHAPRVLRWCEGSSCNTSALCTVPSKSISAMTFPVPGGNIRHNLKLSLDAIAPRTRSQDDSPDSMASSHKCFR